MIKHELLQFSDGKALAESAARQWLDILAASDKSKPFLVAVSGGRIARDFFEAAALLGKQKRNLFNHVLFFWADERCVPPTDPESNFSIARQLLFTPLGVSEDQIHRIHGEEPPRVAADKAEKALLGVAPALAGYPIFDLIFLGMGEDGHVASLFPEEQVPPGHEPIYRAVTATKPPPERITLGYGVIGAAKEVWVLASGAGKADALRASLKNDALTPLGKVIRGRRQTRIFTDIRTA